MLKEPPPYDGDYTEEILDPLKHVRSSALTAGFGVGEIVRDHVEKMCHALVNNTIHTKVPRPQLVPSMYWRPGTHYLCGLT